MLGFEKITTVSYPPNAYLSPRVVVSNLPNYYSKLRVMVSMQYDFNQTNKYGYLLFETGETYSGSTAIKYRLTKLFSSNNSVIQSSTADPPPPGLPLFVATINGVYDHYVSSIIDIYLLPDDNIENQRALVRAKTCHVDPVGNVYFFKAEGTMETPYPGHIDKLNYYVGLNNSEPITQNFANRVSASVYGMR